MTRYVALLRAVNVGGTGKLAMSDLRGLCAAAGFTNVRTYIASGNVVFDAEADEAAVKATLELALLAHARKPVGVVVRTGPEMATVLAANPFQDAAPNRVVAIFLDKTPAAEWRTMVTGVTHERLAAGAREIFIHYPDGQAETKLKAPVLAIGTGRNMNTVAKLAEMAAQAG